jgi:hypothetical protein
MPKFFYHISTLFHTAELTEPGGGGENFSERPAAPTKKDEAA